MPASRSSSLLQWHRFQLGFPLQACPNAEGPLLLLLLGRGARASVFIPPSQGVLCAFSSSFGAGHFLGKRTQLRLANVQPDGALLEDARKLSRLAVVQPPPSPG